MKTTQIEVVGVKHIHSSKKNTDWTIINYLYNGKDGTDGYCVGTLWLEGAQPVSCGASLEGLEGYDRNGKRGIVDIV